MLLLRPGLKPDTAEADHFIIDHIGRRQISLRDEDHGTDYQMEQRRQVDDPDARRSSHSCYRPLAPNASSQTDVVGLLGMPHDRNAMLLHLLRLDHTLLTYRFYGRDFRLTDVHGKVLRGTLA